MSKEKSIFIQEVKRDISTFRRLHGKERLQFVWDYFRYKIIVALFSIFVIILFASLIWNGQKPYRLRVCVVLNDSEKYCSSWFDSFIEELKSDGEKGDVDINEDQPFDYDNAYYYVQEMEVMTTVSSQRMDLAICGPDMYDYLLALNACMPLDSALSEDSIASLMDAGQLVKSTANVQIKSDGSEDTSDAIDGYFAVDISDTEFGKTYNDSEDPLYAVIISNTKHLEECVKLVNTLFEK